MKKIKLMVVLLLTFGLSILYSQQTITTSGGNASGNGGSVSYSVGQLVFKTNSSSQGSVAQGVQQPFEISVLAGLVEANGINLILSAYPNPTTDFILLKIENYKIENLTYQLKDINGKLLLNQKINSNETSILMEALSSGCYFLKVNQNKTELKSFKIIKNK